jgi:hypothetical protein
MVASDVLEVLADAVGPSVWSMVRDRQLTVETAKTGVPMARSAALFLLAHHWPVNVEAQNVCEDIAIHDPDASMRAAALCSLGQCYAGTNNERIQTWLTSMIADESQDVRIRRQAYGALFALRGIGIECRPDVMQLRIPEDFDWNFVNRR